MAEMMPASVAGLVRPAELAVFEQRLRQMPEPPIPSLDRDDWRGALAVFLLVFLSTFPVVIPFIVLQSSGLALRVSNGIAIAMLFATGYGYGHLTGRSAWGWAVAMVLVGLTLAGLTMALGG